MKSLGAAVGLVLLLPCASCGGSSGGGGGAEDHAVVAGEWTGFSLTNGHLAKLVHCTGDLTFVEGLTVATVLTLGVHCVTEDPFLVTQVAETIDLLGQSLDCDDGTEIARSGTGSVSRNTLEFTIASDSNAGIVSNDYFDGLVTSDSTLTLFEFALDNSGFLVGSCDIEPAAETLVTYTATAAGSPLGWAGADRRSIAGSVACAYTNGRSK